MEAGHVNYQNYNWTLGHQHFQKTFEMSGIDLELVGVYGKRTKFQQKDVAQLLLKVNRKMDESNEQMIVFDSESIRRWTESNKNLDRNHLPKVNGKLKDKL